jgi:hypothetical protein
VVLKVPTVALPDCLRHTDAAKAMRNQGTVAVATKHFHSEELHYLECVYKNPSVTDQDGAAMDFLGLGF